MIPILFVSATILFLMIGIYSVNALEYGDGVPPNVHNCMTAVARSYTSQEYDYVPCGSLPLDKIQTTPVNTQDTIQIATPASNNSICQPVKIQSVQTKVSGNFVNLSGTILYGNDGTIDWGDGNRTPIFTVYNHTYALSGVYHIRIFAENQCSSAVVDQVVSISNPAQMGGVTTLYNNPQSFTNQNTNPPSNSGVGSINQSEDNPQNEDYSIIFLGIIGIIIAFFSSIFGWKTLIAYLSRPKVNKKIDPIDVCDALKNTKAARPILDRVLTDPDLRTFSDTFAREYESARKRLTDSEKEAVK